MHWMHWILSARGVVDASPSWEGVLSFWHSCWRLDCPVLLCRLKEVLSLRINTVQSRAAFSSGSARLYWDKYKQTGIHRLTQFATPLRSGGGTVLLTIR